MNYAAVFDYLAALCLVSLVFAAVGSHLYCMFRIAEAVEDIRDRLRSEQPPPDSDTPTEDE